MYVRHNRRECVDRFVAAHLTEVNSKLVYDLTIRLVVDAILTHVAKVTAVFNS